MEVGGGGGWGGGGEEVVGMPCALPPATLPAASPRPRQPIHRPQEETVLFALTYLLTH